MGTSRTIAETKLLLEGPLIRHCQHELEEVLCISHKLLTDRDGVGATLVICQADLTEEFVMSRSNFLWIHDDRKKVILVDHFEELEVGTDVLRCQQEVTVCTHAT